MCRGRRSITAITEQVSYRARPQGHATMYLDHHIVPFKNQDSDVRRRLTKGLCIMCHDFKSKSILTTSSSQLSVTNAQYRC